MKIIDSIMENNPSYKAHKEISPKGIMLHSVGCSQPSAKVFVKNWNKPTYTRASVHAFIDANDGNVYQTLPWDIRAIHAGGSANNTHIGVEMCEPGQIRYTSGASFEVDADDKDDAIAAVRRTYDSAVELFAFLCKEYKLDPLKKGVIISHNEGNDLGVASNHGDPEHLWKGLKLEYTMDKFRQDVKLKMADNSNNQIDETVHSEEEEVPFKVKVEIPNLNIRKGPGTRYDRTGYTGKGVFTIVEVDGNWGLLKAYQELRNGWISLNYVKKA